MVILPAAVALVCLELAGVIRIFGNDLESAVSYTGIIVPLLLLFLGYVHLRNIYVYLFWLAIGAVMFFFYAQYKEDPRLIVPIGSAAGILRSTLFFLLVFQLIQRVYSLLGFPPYVSPSRGGQIGIMGDRDPALPDFIAMAIMFFTIFASGLGL